MCLCIRDKATVCICLWAHDCKRFRPTRKSRGREMEARRREGGRKGGKEGRWGEEDGGQRMLTILSKNIVHFNV